MKECCKDQTTPHCPQCGANLKANSLLGLKADLEKRLETAYELQNSWKERQEGVAESDKKKVANGIARTQRRIDQLGSWLTQLDQPVPATESRPHRAD